MNPPKKNTNLDTSDQTQVDLPISDEDKTRVDVVTPATQKKITQNEIQDTQIGIQTPSRPARIFEDTAIFSRPPTEHENTSVNIPFKDLDETTRIFQTETVVQPPTQATPASHPPLSSAPTPIHAPIPQSPRKFAASDSDSKQRTSIFSNLIDALGCLLLLGILLLFTVKTDSESPLKVWIQASSLSALFVTSIFVFWKRRFSAGTFVSLVAVLGLITVSIATLGSGHPHSVLLWKDSQFTFNPWFFLNFCFVAIGLRLALYLLLQDRFPLTLRFLLFLGLGYANLEWIQNIFLFFKEGQFYAFEDTLSGTALFQRLHPNLRPTLFAFKIFFPLLCLYGLIHLAFDLAYQTKRSKSALNFLTLSVGSSILGWVILSSNGILQFLPQKIMRPTGAQISLKPPSGTPPIDLCYGPCTAQSIPESQRAFNSATEAKIFPLLSIEDFRKPKRKIFFRLRGQNGRLVSELQKKDFTLLLSGQKIPFEEFAHRMQGHTEMDFLFFFHFSKSDSQGLTPENHSEGLETSESLSATHSSTWITQKLSSQPLFEFTNSHEHLWFANSQAPALRTFQEGRQSDPFVDYLSKTDISATLDQLEKSFPAALESLAEKFGKKTVFFVSNNGKDFSTALQKKVAPLLKQKNIDLVFVQLLNRDPTLEAFAKEISAVHFFMKTTDEITTALPQALVAVFPDYELSYQVAMFVPTLEWKVPKNGSEILADLSLTLKISNFEKEKLGKAKFWMDGKIIQEKDMNTAEWTVSIPYTSTVKGEHRFKMSVQTQDGNQIIEEFSTPESILLFTVPQRFEILSPQNGSEVSGLVKIEAKVEGPPSKLPARVEWFLAGKKIHELHSAPYVYEWDTQKLKGPQNLEIKAIFRDGSEKTKSLQVVVPPPRREPRRGRR